MIGGNKRGRHRCVMNFRFFFFFSFFEGKKKTWRMMKFSVREVEQILNLSPRFKEDVASRGGGNVGNN